MPEVVKSYKQRGKVMHTLLTVPVGSGEDEDGNETKITYMVRGMSPIERQLHSDIISVVEPPTPPTKKRAVVPPGGKLQAAQIEMEDYPDVDDPTFREQWKLYQEEYVEVVQRASMYRLMICVQGFDVSDADIKSELSEEAIPRDSLENLCKRVDQVCRIILPEFDQRHMMALLARISELTGVQTEKVNFI